MQPSNRHIILIGFKHTGKSVIGEALARRLYLPFVDLDNVTAQLNTQKTKETLTCRQIVNQYTENYFRKLEQEAFQQCIATTPSIISLGGGTPINEAIHPMLAEQVVIHITAPQGIVFERILVTGRPGFIDQDANMLETFENLWERRQLVYAKLQQLTIINHKSIDASVGMIINFLLKNRKNGESR